MKIPVKILAVLSSFTLLCGFALPHNSYAAELSQPKTSVGVTSESEEAAAKKMREFLKSRTEIFTVEIPRGDGAVSEAACRLLKKAFDETGNGTEGDYLRFAVKSYKCSISSNSTTSRLTYTVEYYTTTEEEAVLTDKLSGILAALRLDGKSDRDKIADIYEYALLSISYSKDTSDPYAYTAYNAAVNGNAVCQGITQLLYRMYNDSGIPCRIIAGTSNNSNGTSGNHVWLIVKLEGIYYLLDPTWDLNRYWTGPHYFLRGSEDFDSEDPSITHIPQGETNAPFPDYTSEDFLNSYPISRFRYSPNSSLRGDVNGDGLINSVDASMVLAEYARISNNFAPSFTGSRFDSADVNRDGKIDSVDSSKILAYYAAVSSGSGEAPAF